MGIHNLNTEQPIQLENVHMKILSSIGHKSGGSPVNLRLCLSSALDSYTVCFSTEFGAVPSRARVSS